MKQFKIIILSFLIPLLLVTSISVVSYFLDYKKNASKIEASKNAKIEAQPEKVPLTIKGFSLHEMDKNRVYEFFIKAREGKLSHISNKVDCYDIECWLKNRGIDTAFLTAEHSIVKRDSKQFFLVGPVNGWVRDVKIQGSDIAYDFETQKIVTKNKTTFIHPCFWFCSQQSVIDLKSDEFQMDGGVKTEFLQSPAGDGRNN